MTTKKKAHVRVLTAEGRKRLAQQASAPPKKVKKTEVKQTTS